MSSTVHRSPSWLILVLLLFGGMLFGIGELVGIVLLWSSGWALRERILGTLIPLAEIGLFACLGLMGHTSCSRGCGGATLGNFVAGVGFVTLIVFIGFCTQALLRTRP